MTIREQSFILEGKTVQEARDSFDAADIDFFDEVLCNVCEKIIDSKNHCSCQQTEKKEEGKLYVCTEEDCIHETFWTFEDLKEKGEPVCPNDDTDLVQACDNCGEPEDDDGRCSCSNKDALGV